LSKPHWDGCREGVLRVQRCRDCGAYVFIPQPLCTACFSDGLTWVESAGRGTLYSYTVVHRAPHPAFATPYVVAIVELAEGFRMLANLECEPERARVGMPLRVVFRAVANEISLPRFIPDDARMTRG
jgi:hypothetical protein